MSEFQSRRERREAERRAQQAQWEADHGLSESTPESQRRQGSLATDQPREEAAPVPAPQASLQRDQRGISPSDSPYAAPRDRAEDSDLDEDDSASASSFAPPAPATRARGVGGWTPDGQAGLSGAAPAPQQAGGNAQPPGGAQFPGSSGFGASAPSSPGAAQAPAAFSGPPAPTVGQSFGATQRPLEASSHTASRSPEPGRAFAPPQAPPPVAAPAPSPAADRPAVAPAGGTSDEPGRFASRAEWREYRRRQGQDDASAPQAPGAPGSGTQDTGIQGPSTHDPGAQDLGAQAPGVQDRGTQGTGTQGTGSRGPSNQGQPPAPGSPVVRQAPQAGPAQGTWIATGASSDPASLDGFSLDDGRSSGSGGQPGASFAAEEPRYGERGARPQRPEPELSTDTASFSSIPEPDLVRHSSEQTRATEEPSVQSSAPDLTERRTRSRRKSPVIKPPSTAGVSIVTGSQPQAHPPAQEGTPAARPETSDEWDDDEYVDESELKEPPVKPMTARSVSRQEEPLLVGRSTSKLPIIALTVAVGLAVAFGIGALIFLFG